jgi:hypothetical protein
VSKAVFETDWLGTEPVYYNETTGAVSHSINDVVDFADLEFDPEGFNGFLDRGYSAFGLTPVRHVKYLAPWSRLTLEDDGRLTIESIADEKGLADRLEDQRSEAEVIEILRGLVERWERSVEGDIVVPTSGGYDSRLLNLMIGDKSRIRSFTFGVSDRQHDSSEVAKARLLAERLGTRWERVPIGYFNLYIEDWDRIFGACMHAHGMYHLEFFTHVLARVGAGRPVLSGWDIDVFSGQDKTAAPPLRRPSDVETLIWRRFCHGDSSQSLLEQTHDVRDAYFEDKRELLASRRMRTVEAVRFRTLWLHFLKRLPEHLGLPTYCPGNDFELATAMLSLPLERRRDRRWVADFFVSQGQSLWQAGGTSSYWINYYALRHVPPRPLDERLLGEVVKPEYVRWANANVSWKGLWSEGLERLQGVHGLRRGAHWVRDRGLGNRRTEAYFAYLTLWPIESLLRRRDRARSGGPPP